MDCQPPEKSSGVGSPYTDPHEGPDIPGLVVKVAQQFENLCRDPEAWASYLAEAETTSVADGVEQESYDFLNRETNPD